MKTNSLHLVTIRIDFLKIAINIEKRVACTLNSRFFKKLTLSGIKRGLPKLHCSPPGIAHVFLSPRNCKVQASILSVKMPPAKVRMTLLCPTLIGYRRCNLESCLILLLFPPKVHQLYFLIALSISDDPFLL